MRIFTSLIVLCLLCCATMAFAQNATAYRLGPEDTFAVTVLKHPEFSGEFLVPPDGSVDLPGVGKLLVTNLTLDELTTAITERLKARLNTPEVSVSLRTPRLQRIYVLGAVKQPGVYDLKAQWRVTEALAAAGGLSADAQDCTATLLRAADGQLLTLAVPEILAANPVLNLPIASGDVLTINVIPTLPVFVTGAVKLPGLLQLKSGQGVVEALALAGGVMLPVDEATASITRGPDTLPVDLKAKTPLSLHAGDVLTIASTRTVRVMMTGQVKTPGLYTLTPTEGILEALALAGGANEHAAVSRVQILHATGVTQRVDLSTALLNGTTDLHVTLQTGDLVLVPENTATVVVMGYVKQPGALTLTDGRRYHLVDLIGLAGGPQDKRAGTREIGLVTTDATGKQVAQRVDLQRFYKTGDARYNPEIKPGDVIYVPETSRTDWQVIFQAITSVGVISNILR